MGAFLFEKPRPGPVDGRKALGKGQLALGLVPSMYFFDVATDPANPRYLRSMSTENSTVPDTFIELAGQCWPEPSQLRLPPPHRSPIPLPSPELVAVMGVMRAQASAACDGGFMVTMMGSKGQGTPGQSAGGVGPVRCGCRSSPSLRIWHAGRIASGRECKPGSALPGMRPATGGLRALTAPCSSLRSTPRMLTACPEQGAAWGSTAAQCAPSVQCNWPPCSIGIEGKHTGKGRGAARRGAPTVSCGAVLALAVGGGLRWCGIGWARARAGVGCRHGQQPHCLHDFNPHGISASKAHGVFATVDFYEPLSSSVRFSTPPKFRDSIRLWNLTTFELLQVFHVGQENAPMGQAAPFPGDGHRGMGKGGRGGGRMGVWG